MKLNKKLTFDRFQEFQDCRHTGIVVSADQVEKAGGGGGCGGGRLVGMRVGRKRGRTKDERNVVVVKRGLGNSLYFYVLKGAQRGIREARNKILN